MTREQIFAAIRARYSSSDLDEHVHELKAQEASSINNGGIDAQLEYLEQTAGIDCLARVFLSETA